MKFLPFDISLGLAFTLIALLRPVWRRIKSLPARGWLTIQGTVRSAQVERARGGFVDYYLVQVTYTYVLNGEYYAGSYEKSFFRKKSAEEFAAELKSQMAFVRYKPDLPERSTLLEQDQYGWPR